MNNTPQIEELLIYSVAQLLAGLDHVAVGASSPVPGAGALLARELSGGRLRVSILGSREHGTWSDGGRELFDCAAQGRIDAFFLSGVQIDGSANINLVGPGAYPETTKRFSGSFGSAYMYHVVPKVILFTLAHSPRVLVPKVDFISAAGTSAPDVFRPGGPRHLLTNRCVFDFDTPTGRFSLNRLHPGETEQSVRDATGFEFDAASDVPQTPAPDAQTLACIRGPVASAVGETYPGFAKQVFGAA